MLKIEQLISADSKLTCDEQQKVLGGYNTTEELWENYAGGGYDISTTQRHLGKNGNFAKFTGEVTIGDNDEEKLMGVINLDTGKQVDRYDNDD